MRKDIYYLFLTIFILYVAFAAIPSDEVYIHPYLLYSQQQVTVQFYCWLLFLRLAMLLIFAAWYYESREENKRMLKILVMIHAWYLVEYILHYTSVWITWKQLGFGGNDFDGLSSHVFTMLAFAYFARK